MTAERIGLARNHPSLPDIELQRELLASVGGCGSVIEVEAGSAGEKRLDKFLATLAKGTAICVVNLDVFGKSLPDMVRLLRDLGELSISVAIVNRKDGEAVIRPRKDVIQLLRHLSAYNGRALGPTADGPSWYGRPFRPAEQFNRHQILHVRKLYGEGMPLRAIGLIFQTSPEEVWKVVS